MTTFAQIVERVHALSYDEREELLRILQASLREDRGAQILVDVKEAEKEYESGVCKPASVAEIMRAIRR